MLEIVVMGGPVGTELVDVVVVVEGVEVVSVITMTDMTSISSVVVVAYVVVSLPIVVVVETERGSIS